MPANNDPIITASAPAPKALAISPEYLIPPSAIILMFIALHSCNINQKRKKKKCDCPGFSQLNALSPYFEIPNLNYLNEKFNNLKNSLGNVGESKLLLITSISVLDEYYETKKKIDIQKSDIAKITEKFKELKSLVYNYRDLKEKEISELGTIQENLNNEIESHKNDYELLVDKTTSEIENFIKRIDTDPKTQ